MTIPAPPLPRPDVAVTTRETPVGSEADITVSRDGMSKTYSGRGTPNGAVKEAVEKLLGDGHTAEWLPARGEQG